VLIGIHHTGNRGFSERWIAYCEHHNIPYKIVDAYSSDIIKQLENCHAFMWQHHQSNYKDVLFAKQLLYSLEFSGKKVFPNFNTGWHFDDKVGQKYLLECIGAPLVPAYVFYTEAEAVAWVNKTNFPKVFKLRGGAGSANVILAQNRNDALKLISRAFGKGFIQYNWMDKFKEACRQKRIGNAGWREVLRPIYYALKKHPTEFSKYKGNEKGYVYFQEFIPENQFDIRVIVVDNKAFGIKRIVRDGDFRASGSGQIVYDRKFIDERCVKISFDVSRKLRSQSIAYDYVFNERGDPLIVEISFAFMASGYDKCPGYWDENMRWHYGDFNPYGWMVDMMLEK
tara:strand:+ start:825 stop:1844 length:1020 start_codon:yes stop_codon:yes gene_type:complete